ncbi:serine esterase [Nonlabens tegetincola]|uniref:Serine esterase n=1 Tax=Nonlabens tegetincola TaxID=323273 RepID=A0A090Q5X0_9FLAO|nr:phospholipase [Nonlabens tegetincola]GAK97597.1 serine esterase [Nonlabens tegetincola]
MTNTSLSIKHIIRPAVQENAPLLLLLHGYGSNEEDLFSFSSEIDPNIFVVSARAPYEIPPYGAAWYAINFDAAGGKFSDLDQAKSSMELLDTFIEELKNSYPIDPNNINLLGFSQGAILSYALSFKHLGMFNNVVAMSGYLNKELIENEDDVVARFRESVKKTNYFISHGTMDQVIPLDWASEAPKFMSELKADYLYKNYPIGHGVSRDNFYDMKEWLEKRIF